MSNISRELTILKCVRCIGSKNFDTNEVFGGVYIPAHVNAKGQQVSARWEGNFAINNKGYIDAEGQAQDRDSDLISITAWNGKTPGPRGGQADIFARAISIGIEISLDTHLRTYEGECWTDNGIQGGVKTRVNLTNGQPLLIDKIGFTVIPNSLIIGQEAQKVIEADILLYQGSGGQQGRPPQWNNRAHADYQIFRQICQVKNALMYTPGADRFGYSMVKAVAATGNAYQAVNAAVVNPAMVANAMGPVLVEGHTYEAFITAGATDEQMLAQPRFQAFHQMILNKQAIMGNGVNPIGPVNPAIVNTGVLPANVGGPGVSANVAF